MPLLLQDFLSDHSRFAVWYINEPTEVLAEGLLLTSQEQAYLMQRSAGQKQQQFLVARRLFALLIGESRPVLYQQSGRPYAPGAFWSISVSHSGAYVAVAVAEGREIGIDIELSPRRSLWAGRNYYLNEDEQGWAGQAESYDLLHLVWSAKEAVFKFADNPGLDFKNDITVLPFEPGESGSLVALIGSEAGRREVVLRYFRKDCCWIVVTDV